MLNDLVNRSRPLPANSKLLILGGGFSGGTMAALVRALGTPVLCSRRQPDKPKADLCFDSEQNLLPNVEDLTDVTHLLSTIPPGSDGHDPVLSTMLPLLQHLPLRWVGYLSTTGVYGDQGGRWVSESDPANPGQERSQRRLNCEKAWQNSGLPVQIMRLPGIYGPGRSVINTLRAGRARMIIKPGQVFSRIHVEDVAGACLHLIHQAEQQQPPGIVNISDNCPAPSSDLLHYAAELMQLKPPPEESFDQASVKMSAMAQSFWSENRRVNNQLLCRTLGYELLHPDFRAGLTDCWRQDQDRLNPLAADSPVRQSATD